MRLNTLRNGYVLPLALVLTVCAGIVASSVVSYLSGVTRQSARYTAKNDCRLAALSALDKVRGEIYEGFMGCTGIKAQLLKQTTLRWFTSVTAGDNYIGTTEPVYFDDVIHDVEKNFPDHDLRVRIAAKPVIRGTRAHVPIIAAARRKDGTGEATLMATISYGMDRSRVFDHAYFVNNYGWFSGSTITANGDVRANGDMSLSSGPKVNGHVYAAENTELRVLGNVSGSANYDNAQTYRNATYGTQNRARPLQQAAGDGGYDPPKSDRERLHSQAENIEMPWISDLGQYIEYGQTPEIQSTLKQGGTYYVDNRTSNRGKDNYGYYTGTGPSGNAEMPDNHALVLEGTYNNPIELNGPVVISNDVVIKGYVTGQGTIYSQRNIHIVGNIQYKNPPTWADKQQNSANSEKDLLCLAARGNIVLGDPTSSSWLSSTLKNCISTTPYVQKYVCAENANYSSSDTRHYEDADIGYPRRREYSDGTTKYNETQFCGNYTQADGGTKTKETKTEKFHNETTRDPRTGRTTTKKVSDGYEYTYSKDTTRKYYDSVVPSRFIQEKASTITQIDAVLYNNHGIFGNIGACTINGSLVCRNEGMIFSGSLFINWDYRLYSGSSESVANSIVGMPVSAAAPVVLALQEVPDDWVSWPTANEAN